MKIEGILLDIDNTLYDYEKAHKAGLDTVLNSLVEEYSLDKERLKDAYQNARLEINKELNQTASSHNRALYFQRMLEMLDINLLKLSLQSYNIYWDTFLENMEVYDGVYDFLSFIKDRKICLLSDLTANIQHRKIEKLRLFDYAQFLVTSEEAGREKPHPYIFLLALKKLRLTSPQVCMIGDSYEKDIIGAINLEIKPYWLNTKNEKREAHNSVVEFKSFRDLKSYLK